MIRLYIYIAAYLLLACLILYSGSRLSKYGDLLAGKLGWGKMFVGVLLMASVTSMPEFMTGMSSVLIVDSPDIAVGDIVGSCAFNILIISMMDLFYNKSRSLTSAVSTGHVIAASFSIIMLCIVLIALIMPGMFLIMPGIDGFSIIIFILYIIGMRIVFLFEKKQPVIASVTAIKEHPLGTIIARFSIHACLVVLAAILLPFFGKQLAGATGLSESFWGTSLIAISTSLPELAVSISAIRLGTIDLAIGNLFGSNLVNIGLLAVYNILYSNGSIFSFINPVHVIPVTGTIIITAIGIIGIVYREKKKWKLALDTSVIALVYALMLFMVLVKN